MFIYGLFSPEGELRYVGKTLRSLSRRLKQHLWTGSLRKENHRNSWIKSLLAKGQSPDIQLIQALNTVADLNEAEKYWIGFFRNQGCDLVNGTDGGDGGATWTGKVGYWKGKKFSAEDRQHQREGLARVNWSERMKDRGISLESVQKMKANMPHRKSIVDEDENVYQSIREAARALGIKSTHNIVEIFQGKRRTALGHTFRPVIQGAVEPIIQLPKV